MVRTEKIDGSKNGKTILEFQNVSKSFLKANNHAVNDVTLSVRKGEIFGIIGQTGAGKSTLLRFANLLETPDSGRILFEDKNITRLKGALLREHRRNVGMVFQQFQLFSNRRVFDNIALPLKAAGWKQSNINDRVFELLSLVGIHDKKNSYPAQLSGGQKQRVGIARALANRPHLLLCDEPTSALDPETTRSILSLLKEINKTLGVTILLVTHEMDVVRDVCDTVAVMEQGRVVESGSCYSLFADPLNQATRRLTGSVLSQSIPAETLARTTGRILRIVLKNEVATQPILGRVIQATNIVPNILHSNVEYISGQPIGIFYLETDPDERITETIRSAFIRYGAIVEEISK
ncbi:ABC transporter, ATP-binding protein [Leptospira fainei serovar Hurstbridge str. BUT 6]|uniref:Cell division ATP-binding protein FtsE n=1 Tax=Leptospira fainei serovar Hurstbridge str. BUT 6 TaxID=1193011 RepID=S3W1P2_9LEPT|nr:ATP-binding cassette domain-containing protein [Leptospira fainei]EPG74222.1 ABC transporter, ATP-binding protein [Leptospira fainei serovar Hurstbridge str. BUT 6]